MHRCAGQTRERIDAFVGAVAAGGFRLTRSEILALVNTQPTSIVEIHLIVDDCEVRLTPEMCERLRQLCVALNPERAQRASMPPTTATASAAGGADVS